MGSSIIQESGTHAALKKRCMQGLLAIGDAKDGVWQVGYVQMSMI